MSFISAPVTMVYGNRGEQAARASASQNNQGITEVVSGTTRRLVHGPKRGGRFSVHAIVDAVSGPTSATGLTLWYSNLPDPSLANDNDWVQDTTVGTIIALTATGKALVNVGNVYAMHMMLKADVTAGSASIRAFVKTEGTEV